LIITQPIVNVVLTNKSVLILLSVFDMMDDFILTPLLLHIIVYTTFENGWNGLLVLQFTHLIKAHYLVEWQLLQSDSALHWMFCLLIVLNRDRLLQGNSQYILFMSDLNMVEFLIWILFQYRILKFLWKLKYFRDSLKREKALTKSNLLKRGW
jgi:hypothetical protein